MDIPGTIHQCGIAIRWVLDFDSKHKNTSSTIEQTAVKVGVYMIMGGLSLFTLWQASQFFQASAYVQKSLNSLYQVTLATGLLAAISLKLSSWIRS